MYQVILKQTVRKQLIKLPKRHQERIVKSIDYLAEDPFAGKKLRGVYKNEYSLRVWPYRIIYSVHKKRVMIVVLAIGHRQGVYK